MIVVDTSALMAILLAEPEQLAFGNAIIDSRRALVGTPTAFEFEMVAYGKRQNAFLARPEAVLALPSIEIVPWPSGLVELATQAFRAFGKGHHPAKLNFGDCMAYALAKSLNAPLLYKGNDFAQTDIRSAV